MTRNRVVRCAVCRSQQSATDGWFHVTENRWTDRLRIFRFQETLVTKAAYSVCCVAHVRELVVHWMTTGRLDFPFARLPFSPRRVLGPHRSEATPNAPAVPMTPVLGELAVHRESLTRTLRDNPQALSAVLEALVRALDPENHHAPTAPAATNVPRVPVEEPVGV